MLVESSKSFVIFVKYAIAALLKLILFLVSLLVMTTAKTCGSLLCCCLHHPKMCLLFSTLLMTVVFSRFKLRPTLSMVFDSFYQFSHVIRVLKYLSAIIYVCCVYFSCHLSDTCYHITYSSRLYDVITV